MRRWALARFRFFLPSLVSLCPFVLGLTFFFDDLLFFLALLFTILYMLCLCLTRSVVKVFLALSSRDLPSPLFRTSSPKPPLPSPLPLDLLLALTHVSVSPSPPRDQPPSSQLTFVPSELFQLVSHPLDSQRNANSGGRTILSLVLPLLLSRSSVRVGDERKCLL